MNTTLAVIARTQLPRATLPRDLTPEGLTIEKTKGEGQTIIRERGLDGYLIHKYERFIFGDLDGSPIWSYREQPDFLLERLLELENRSSQPDSSRACTANLEMARRRLRRWHREWAEPVLHLRDPLDGVARRAMAYREPDPSSEEIAELIAIDTLSLEDYYRRKAEIPPLILKTVPAHLPPLIGEANEAFARGLWRSAIALSRCMLEDVVKRVVSAQKHRTAEPRSWRDFHALMSCVPEDVLASPEKERVRELYERGNGALHRANVTVTEEVACAALTETARMIEIMIRSDGLRQGRSSSVSTSSEVTEPAGVRSTARK